MKKVNYAVLVLGENGFKFVTETEGSWAKWTDGQKAKLYSKTTAENIAYGLCPNRHLAMVVIVPDYIENLGN